MWMSSNSVPTPLRIASMVLAGGGLVLVLALHLLPALLAGLLVYELVHVASSLLQQRIHGYRARILIVAVLGVVLVGLLGWLIIGAISLLRSAIGDPHLLWCKQWMPLLEKAREQLPHMISTRLPDNVDKLQQMLTHLAQVHVASLKLMGKHTAAVLMHILIGLLLGAMVALRQAYPLYSIGPLGQALTERCRRLGEAFHHIAFAQIRIALINAVLTAIFLLGVLPLLGIHVPLSNILVMLTFVLGLLPLIGNLISNVALTIAALSVSLGVGIAALCFLILIHKLEYFINARIVGRRIRAYAWEVLLAMLVLESFCGLSGLIAAPIYYAYLKRELMLEGLI